jgi:precorrin-3B methylase
MHAFLCDPGAEDRQLRDRMLNAILAKDGGGVAVVAGGLVAAFGMSPAVAAIVAALAVKLIVAPAAKELCKTWGDALANEIGSKS